MPSLERTNPRPTLTLTHLTLTLTEMENRFHLPPPPHHPNLQYDEPCVG